jgi:hypothetical protein
LELIDEALRARRRETNAWVRSWCLLYRVEVRRGEAVWCRQMVTDNGGSSRRPFRLGRGNEGGGADFMGEEERSRWHFVSPAHERGRAADVELWHDGVVGQAAVASGGWRSRMTLGWAGLGLQGQRLVLVSVGMKENRVDFPWIWLDL